MDTRRVLPRIRVGFWDWSNGDESMTRYGWIFITLIPCAAFFGWRREVAPVGPTRVTILYDRSLSSTGGCAALVGLGGRVLATGAHELALFSTGDLKSAFEPVRLGVIAIPV